MNLPIEPVAGMNFNDMSAYFARSPLAQVDNKALRAWQPLRRSMWRAVQPLMAIQAACRTEYRQVDGHQLCFWTAGTGDETVLLLHGFGSSKENWAFLTARLDQYRILVLDLPGFGRSDFRYGEDYSLAAQADRVAMFLDQEKLSHCHVAGSSMGGAIAALLASRRPDKVKSLTLMNAAGMTAERVSLLETGLIAGINPLAPATRRDTWRVFTICLHRRYRALGGFLSFLLAGEMSHRKVVNDFLFSQLVASQQSTYDCLAKVSVPTLVMWGEDDQVLDASCVQGFCRQIPHAKSVVFPEVGHLPMLEVPGKTAAALRDFWRSTC